MHLTRLIATLLTAAVAIFVSAQGHADDATSSDIIRLDQNGGAFEKAIPVYDQLRHSASDSGLCYAITASELIDADRFRQGDGLQTLTSPLQIALTYHAGLTNPVYRTAEDFHGYTERIIDDQTSAIDMISQADAVSDVFALVRGTNLCDQKFLQHFDGEIATRAIDMSLLGRPAEDDSTENFLRQLLIQVEAVRDTSVKKPAFFNLRVTRGFLPAVTLARASLTAANEIAPVQQSLAFVNALCSGHQVGSPVPLLRTLKIGPSAQAKKQAYEHVVALLQDGRPVGIQWDPTVAVYGFGSSPGHASVIIGRRVSAAGDSDMLIRNSYGLQCQPRGAPHALLHPCENGSEWVPAAALFQSASEISWIAADSKRMTLGVARVP